MTCFPSKTSASFFDGRICNFLKTHEPPLFVMEGPRCELDRILTNIFHGVCPSLIIPSGDTSKVHLPTLYEATARIEARNLGYSSIIFYPLKPTDSVS